jgi:zinc dependent phospholipase C
MRIPRPYWRRTVVCLLIMMFCSAQSPGYSVLTHEELIDLAWDQAIRPILLKQFPTATEAQLREAHAFAYGGSAIQDMGYYPFGKPFFSDLTHYVRSGDLVAWLLQNAQTINECAFAIGALSHYLGDSLGHSEAVNPATAVAFPKLARKFGKVVTYDQSPHGHIRTEFAFDVGQLANEEFAPPSYLRYIGLRVPRRFLERAFFAVYGFDMNQVVGRARPALRSYRTSVRTFIPAFAEAEVVLHGDDFPTPANDETYQRFIERVRRTNYERRWNHPHSGPGFKAHLLAVLVFIVPKIGPISDLAIKIPTPETQDWYLRSVNHTVDEFHRILLAYSDDAKFPELANIDLDTGYPVERGDYPRADSAHRRLLERLTAAPNVAIPATLKGNLLEYFAGIKESEKGAKKVKRQLEILVRMETRP